MMLINIPEITTGCIKIKTLYIQGADLEYQTHPLLRRELKEGGEERRRVLKIVFQEAEVAAMMYTSIKIFHYWLTMVNSVLYLDTTGDDAASHQTYNS